MFKSYQTNLTKRFSFETIFQDYSQTTTEKYSTPTKKTSVDYKLKDKALYISLSFNILNNLYCLCESNSLKLSKFICLYKLLKKADSIQQPDDNITARLIIALHGSKIDDFFKIISPINSLLIINDQTPILNGDSSITVQLNYFSDKFFKLKVNKKIVENSNKIVEFLTQEVTEFSFTQIKLYFFTSDIDGLKAFSGQDTIYISHDYLENILIELNKNIDLDCKLLLLDLEFIRMVQHELTHVAVRNCLGDMNCSTPKLVNDLKLPKSSYVYAKAGVLAEQRIFAHRIDFQQTSQNPNTNYGYIREFIDGFMNPKIDGIKQFDFEKSKVMISDVTSKKSAFDMDDVESEFSYE